MQKAILWDRDGVLNHVLALRESDGEKNISPQKFEDFKLVDGAVEVLTELRKRGYLNIVHTNQPDIARGKMPLEELMKMHDFLKQYLPIEAFYVCPHGKYDKSDVCNCRKPKSGLLLDAQKDFNLDLEKSWVVGDSGRDIEAGLSVGTKNIFVRTEYNKEYKYPNTEDRSYFEVKSLKNVLKIIT